MEISKGFDEIKHEYLLRHYESNSWERHEVIHPLISLETVLATQALVMKARRRQDRSAFSRKKRHGFAALNNLHSSEWSINDNSIEEYLACRVAKVDYDQWRMLIRFRRNHMNDEFRRSSFIDNFKFDWVANGNLQAWRANYLLKSGDSETPTEEVWHDIRPVDESDVEELHTRIKTHLFESYIVKKEKMKHTKTEN